MRFLSMFTQHHQGDTLFVLTYFFLGFPPPIFEKVTSAKMLIEYYEYCILSHQLPTFCPICYIFTYILPQYHLKGFRSKDAPLLDAPA